MEYNFHEVKDSSYNLYNIRILLALAFTYRFIKPV